MAVYSAMLSNTLYRLSVVCTIFTSKSCFLICPSSGFVLYNIEGSNAMIITNALKRYVAMIVKSSVVLSVNRSVAMTLNSSVAMILEQFYCHDPKQFCCFDPKEFCCYGNQTRHYVRRWTPENVGPRRNLQWSIDPSQQQMYGI